MPYFLPEKFNFKHNFVFFLHDILANIIKTGENNGVFFHSFNLKNNSEAKIIESLNNDELFDFLQENGYEAELNHLLMRQIFDATLSDFLHFVYTALDTSERGKLSVTYALLRKPFKDNLFILEWLLANPDEFMSKFKSNNSNSEIAIDKISPDKKKQIIQGANSKASFSFLDSDFLYEIRYDKSKSYSLESMWNKANHLVTSYKTYSTEDMNLNFVFSQESDKLTQWENLYFILPSLLLQTIFVSDSLYKTFSNGISLLDDELILKLTYAYALASNQFRDFPLETHYNQIPLTCKKCNSEIIINENNEKSAYNNGYLKCKKGHKNYIFE